MGKRGKCSMHSFPSVSQRELTLPGYVHRPYKLLVSQAQSSILRTHIRKHPGIEAFYTLNHHLSCQTIYISLKFYLIVVNCEEVKVPLIRTTLTYYNMMVLTRVQILKKVLTGCLYVGFEKSINSQKYMETFACRCIFLPLRKVEHSSNCS